MANGIKYQAHEILNKVLNAAETGLQVDIVAGAEYAEDSAHTSEDTGNFILGVRNDTLAALGGADGDYVPFQMNASGALYVEIAAGGANDSIYIDDADWSDGSSKHTLVGGLYQSTPQSITDGDVGPFQVDADGALHISDGGNTITVDGTVTANLSSTDNTVLDNILTKNTEIDAVLDTIDADTGAIKTAVEIIDNAISGSEMQVDIVADGAGLATDANLAKMLYGNALVITAIHGGSGGTGTQDLSGTYEALYIGVGGDVVVTMVGTGNFTFKNVASGQLLPIRITHVIHTNTTATNMIALKT